MTISDVSMTGIDTSCSTKTATGMREAVSHTINQRPSESEAAQGSPCYTSIRDSVSRDTWRIRSAAGSTSGITSEASNSIQSS